MILNDAQKREVLKILEMENSKHERFVLETKRKYTKEQIMMDVLISHECFSNYTIFEDRFYLEDAFTELLQDYNISEDEVIKFFIAQLKIYWNTESEIFYENHRLSMNN